MKHRWIYEKLKIIKLCKDQITKIWKDEIKRNKTIEIWRYENMNMNMEINKNIAL